MLGWCTQICHLKPLDHLVCSACQRPFKDEDTSVPTSEGKSTAHDVKVKEGLPEIKQKCSKVVLDHHKFPKAHKPNEGRSSESTADNPAAVPASQVNVSVDNTPHTKTDAEPKPRRSTGDIVGADTLDVAVKPILLN